MTTPTPHGAPELLPCPFCGRETPDDLEDTLYPSGGYWRETDGLRHYVSHRDRKTGDSPCWTMHCGTGGWRCGAQITADTREEAIAAWNCRAIQQAAGAVPEGPLRTWHDEADRLKKCVDYATSEIEAMKFRNKLAQHLNTTPVNPASDGGSSGHLAACDGGGVTQPAPDDGSQYLDKLYLMQACIRQGWRMAAGWAKRDDLLADIGSPAYLKEMAEFLSKYINPTPGTPEMRVTDLSIDMDESLADYGRNDPLMNDPDFVEMAELAAARILAYRPESHTAPINPGSVAGEGVVKLHG